MRFFVEVTPIGKTETQQYCVDAESWQKALQAARTMRKEDGSISGFSIELADDGYRAVDPTARLRYMVKKAPAEAQLSTPSTAPPPVAASQPPPAQPAAAAAPPKQSISVPPPRAEDNKKLGGKTVSFASSGTALLASSAPVPRASPSRPSQSKAPAAPAPVAASGLVAERKAAPVAPPAQAIAPAPVVAVAPSHDAPPSGKGVGPIVVLYKKEQAPTAASPISYREEVFAAPPGTTEEQAEAILRAEFSLVTNALASAPSGKYVNLAVFDRVFEGRPPAPPLATLSWKDWKAGEPTLTFPRRQKEKLASATQPSNLGQAAHVATVTASQIAIPPQSVPPSFTAPAQPFPPAQSFAPQQPAPQQPAPHAAPASVPPAADARSVPASAPPARANVESVPAASVVVAPDVPPPAPLPVPAPEAVAVAPVPAPAPIVEPTPAPPAAASASNTGSFRRVRKPTPSAPDGSRIRVRGDELIALLFEEMHDLHFMADALEGAAFCLWVVLDKLPSKAAFVHFYDIDKREYVIASIAGEAGVDQLTRRNSANDPWLAEAMRRRGAFVVTDASSHEGAGVERFAALGGPRSVVIAPIMLGGRALGAIEIMNPLDGNPYGDDDGNAVAYMAEQLAEFVSSHGIVVDEARIRRSHAQNTAPSVAPPPPT